MFKELENIFIPQKFNGYIFINEDDKNHHDWFHCYKTRPNFAILKQNGKLYKINNVYTINNCYLTKDLVEAAEKRSLENNPHRYSRPSISNYEILYQILKKYNVDVINIDKFKIIDSETLGNRRLWSCEDNFKDIYFIYLDNLEEIKTLTKKEQTYLDNKNKKEAETKIITKLMKNTIETICNQYGMTLKDDRIMFKDYKGLMDFYNIALNQTIIKGLTENGFTINRKNNKRKIGISTVLFTLKDLGLEYGIETDKN